MLATQRIKNMAAVLAAIMVCGVLIAGVEGANVPEMINYQGYLETGGVPVTVPTDMKFRIFDQDVGGTLTWGPETHSQVGFDVGYFSVMLGNAGVPVEAVDLNGSERWLEIEVAPFTGPMTPRIQLTSVPYAHRVATVDGATGGTITSDLSLDEDLWVDGDIGIAGEAYPYDPAILRFSRCDWDLIPPCGYLDIRYGWEGLQFLFWTSQQPEPVPGPIMTLKRSRVGIMTEYPDYTLDVDGDIRATGTIYGTIDGTVSDADKVDGLHASATAMAGYLYPLDGSAKVPNARLHTGLGNGLDADKVDGQHASAFANSSHGHFGDAWSGSGGQFGLEVDHTGSGDGIRSYAIGSGTALYGDNPSWTGYGVYSNGNIGCAYDLIVWGDADVNGSFWAGSKNFKIDHPLDPENKFLYHSCVESPDMMNVYNGNATLEDDGTAVVVLPDYFESLNRDYRYQLTAIGTPGPNLHVLDKIDGNRFKIAGGDPGMEVSWQVTGVRKDPFAETNRTRPEVDKLDVEKGKYLHPKAYGLSDEYLIRPDGATAVKRTHDGTDDSRKRP